MMVMDDKGNLAYLVILRFFKGIVR